MERDCERCFKTKRGLTYINDCTGSKIWLPVGITGRSGEEYSDIIGIENGLGIGNILSFSGDSYMQQSLRIMELL